MRYAQLSVISLFSNHYYVMYSTCHVIRIDPCVTKEHLEKNKIFLNLSK